MITDKCEKCRRAGEKLFLKGERCFSPKCTFTRKPYPPGIFGRAKGKRPKRGLSEFGLQLRARQKTKFSYGLRQRQFANYLKEAAKIGKGDAQAKLSEILESRLDNVVFRMGFSDSRLIARQTVSHGHIFVNGKKVNIPSCRMKIGDRVSIKPQSLNKGLFRNLEIKMKKYNPPSWINLDKSKKEGEIISSPQIN